MHVGGPEAGWGIPVVDSLALDSDQLFEVGMNITDQQLEMMRHALGFDCQGNGAPEDMLYLVVGRWNAE